MTVQLTALEMARALGISEILKNTHPLVNPWAIGRNPTSWEDVERFVPKRFMKSCTLDEKFCNCEWILFGAGRRGCSEEKLRMLVVEFALAQLLHCFDWTLLDKMNGEELDMSKRYGITAQGTRSLHCSDSSPYSGTVTCMDVCLP